jgi:hypothetical protein
METFTSYMGSWNIFYSTLGTASAALMGLVFLAVSLRLDTFHLKDSSTPRNIAWQTFVDFLSVFAISLIFLIPGLAPTTFGLVLGMVALAGLIIVVRRWWRARNHLTLRRSLVAFVPLLISWVGLSVCGMVTIFGLYKILFVAAPIMIFLIGIAIHDAWNLLISS